MPPAALGAVALGGAGLSAGMQVMQGIQQKKAADAQAAGLEGQAGLARESAGMQIGAQDYEANRLMSIARASAAAGGETQGGSAGVVNRMNASEAILKDTAVRYSGELQSSKYMADAANARMAGKQALTGAIIGAGGTLLTGGLKTFAPTGAGGLGAPSPF